MGRSADLPSSAERFRAGADGRWPDDAGCSILHVDMDAFFASVEIRERPELANVPVVVGGVGRRGVVSSANYIARRFGVRSAMPTGQARRLCPRAVFLPPNFGNYRAVSQGVLAIFREITPLVEPLSLDEAFLDVSGALRRLGRTPAGIGEMVRAQVVAEFGITCSVGVSPTKFIAKLASGMAKPDGMLVIPRTEALAFLHPLPVSALWGVGRRTAEALIRSGLNTVADIAATDVGRLRRILGVAAAEHLHGLATGVDDRAVVPANMEKSVGSEETFDIDQHDRQLLRRELLKLAERTAASLRRKGLLARTVSIKVRYADFTTITRSRTLPVPTDVSRDVFNTACRLLDEQTPAGPVRLIGVRVEQLTDSADGGEQLLLDAPEHGWREADRAADLARSRFGGGAVRPASLLDGPTTDRTE
ncbi:MAG TPA: DNA polymerase IV [Pseudonocardiaceae bacterium]|nr:DNA polymerase IV [Pseudonocardiaceae bacterium]